MSSTPFDLLREKREELGLLEPAEASALARQSLRKGVAIGAVLLAVPLGCAALLALRSTLQAPRLERLATVEAEVEQFETRLQGERANLNQLIGANQELVQALIGTRSGSALMRDLQLRVPHGIQLTGVIEQGPALTIKGKARDPQAFERINALQIELGRSPLVGSNQVRLVKGARQRETAQADGLARSSDTQSDTVAFELVLGFRTDIPPAEEKAILEGLGADGLARRLDLLDQERLLR
jgi:Tfp pilus assembly protein PilN